MLLVQFPRGTPHIYDYVTEELAPEDLRFEYGESLKLGPHPLIDGFSHATQVYLRGKLVFERLIKVRDNQEERSIEGLIQYGQIVLAPLRDGRVFIIGGKFPEGRKTVEISDLRPVDYASETFLYDPEQRKYKRGPRLLYDRQGYAATRLADGRIMISGGYGQPTEAQKKREEKCGNYVSFVEIYDPEKYCFNSGDYLNRTRAYHSTVLLGDGRVLLCGGRVPLQSSDSEDSLTSTVEVFDPVTNKFAIIGQLHQARLYAQMVAVGKSGALILEGDDRCPPESNEKVFTHPPLPAEHFADVKSASVSPLVRIPSFGELVFWSYMKTPAAKMLRTPKSFVDVTF
jgi:hypothetical protein